MTPLDTLRAIHDAINQSRWAEARTLTYRAIVAEQKRIADEKTAQNNNPPA
jgi:hypothetical protein